MTRPYSEDSRDSSSWRLYDPGVAAGFDGFREVAGEECTTILELHVIRLRQFFDPVLQCCTGRTREVPRLPAAS
jgi:hypothetical protein